MSLIRATFLLFAVNVFLVVLCPAQTDASNGWRDPSPHHAAMVSVEPGVQLEVLDWGGHGRPLLFLAGLGNTAHIWDNFAPKLTDKHHVYAITRRGFGRSTHTATGYSPERLADDILAVMEKLNIERPVLVGHSLGGEELSSIGTRHPERVSGLVYLDAAYAYAFYDAAGDYGASLTHLREQLNALADKPGDTVLMDQVRASLPQFADNLNRKANSAEHPLPPPYGPPTAADKASFAAMMKRMKGAVGGVPPEAEIHESFMPGPDGSVGALNAAPEAGPAISKSYEHFTAPIHLPMLAVMGYPQVKSADAALPKYLAAAAAADANQARQIDAFESSQPTARVVRIANANHYIFISNETQVLDAMRRFLDELS